VAGQSIFLEFVKKNLTRVWYGSCSSVVIAKLLCSQ
jgi:hypothetical protein